MIRFLKHSITDGVLWALAIGLALLACSSLPYQDDVGFLVSAQADSPEFPVYINGHLCTDMEGNPGLCAKRIISSEDVMFRFDPQTYAYLLSVNCTAGIPVPANTTVPAGQSYSFTLKAADLAVFRSFTCAGEVDPQDRTPPISSFWKASFTIVDAKYTRREVPFLTKQGSDTYLVLGEFARNAWVYDQSRWTRHTQDTVVKIQGEPTHAKAYSESFAARFNYWNMGDQDSGVIP